MVRADSHPRITTEENPMKVELSRIRSLLAALGLDIVANDDAPKIARRINKDSGISRYLDEGQTIEQLTADQELQNLFHAIATEQAAGQLVEVIDDAPIQQVSLPEPTEIPAGKPTKNKKEKKVSTATKAPPKGKKGKKATKEVLPNPKKKVAVESNGHAGASGHMSQLDAAAKVLREKRKALSTQELIAEMAEKGYWKSPAGKTPHNTLYSAILREMGDKKKSRFKKDSPGKFSYVSQN